MNIRRNVLGIIAALGLSLATNIALAADPKKPDGSITIEETQFAVIIGGAMGGGKLTYMGKTSDFKIGGLTAGANVGISKMSATGEVYDLKDIAKFEGTYTQFDAGIAFGGGVGALHLKNEHGVVMKLTSRTQGVQLNIASASGVKVTFK